MRNVFDQYMQPENRLTHSLASSLHHDRRLLRSFLNTFAPTKSPPVAKLTVIEQSLPGKPEALGYEESAQGLPDAMIYSSDGWALMIESKVGASLSRAQLERHTRTVSRCGFDDVHGLAIAVNDTRPPLAGWGIVTWKDVYAWAYRHRSDSVWAGLMVDYFNVAEARMTIEGYLKEGTITEFSGISFDPYTYLESKRVLRLLTQKLRDKKAFIKRMRLDPASGRAAITDQERLWDFISFVPADKSQRPFQTYPHCTVAIGPNDAEAMITFPHGMSPALRKHLHGPSFEDFAQRLVAASNSLTKALRPLKAYRPMFRVMQRRYKTQRSVPMMDGRIEFDLRSVLGDRKPHFGPPIKKQQEWARATYELMVHKRSNIQFQIGVEFYYPRFDELASRDADKYFVKAFEALRPFASPVID